MLNFKEYFCVKTLFIQIRCMGHGIFSHYKPWETSIKWDYNKLYVNALRVSRLDIRSKMG